MAESPAASEGGVISLRTILRNWVDVQDRRKVIFLMTVGCSVAVVGAVGLYLRYRNRHETSKRNNKTTDKAKAATYSGDKIGSSQSSSRHSDLRPDTATMEEVAKTTPTEHEVVSQECIDFSGVLYREMLLGVAIGDAFGAGIEFQSRDWIRENVDFTAYVNKREGPWAVGYTPGKYTDDTEMTVGLMKALIETGDKYGELTKDTLLSFWLREYNEGKEKFGYGRQGHGSIQRYFEGNSSIEDIRSFQREKEYPGNAPPMRAIPLGFLPNEFMFKLAIINADATHPHPKAQAASLLVARATRYLVLMNGKPSDIIQYCKKDIAQLDQETEKYLEAVDELPDSNENELNEHEFEILCGPQPILHPHGHTIYGIGADSMRTAGCVLYVLKHHKSPFATLKAAIRIGGDVDSVASICLGIVAAKFGLDDIPQWLIDSVENKDGLEQLADQFERFVKHTYSPSTSSSGSSEI
jgi:ADP-ribosylglycohydrolase